MTPQQVEVTLTKRYKQPSELCKDKDLDSYEAQYAGIVHSLKEEN